MRPRFASILTHALLCLWAVVCLFPLYWMAITSLKGEHELTEGPFYLPFVDFHPTLSAWRFILSDPQRDLAERYANSAAVGLAATGLTLLLASMAVYGLTRFPRAWGLSSRAITMGILATRILPPIVIVLPLYLMAETTGLLDSRLPLIAVYTAANLPVALWLLQPVLGLRASDQEEAAQLDGASHVTIFFTILLPMAAAGIAAVALLVFVLCWNEYLFAAFLTRDRALTLPPWLLGQLSFREAQTGSGAEEVANFCAATMMMILPVFIFTGFVQRAAARMGLSR